MAKEKIDINTYQLPKEVLLENTINCNLNCLGCKKNKVYKQRSEKSISLQNIERLAIVLKNIGVKKIHFFHQGEPFCSNNIKKEIEILKKYNPSAFIITSTNGSLIDTPEKREAALMFDHIYFSIHGADQKSASKYMKNINFEKAYNNMKEIIRLREEEKTPVLEWKYVLFRWNDKPDLINKAISLAKIAGVDIISFYKTWYPLYAISYRYYLGFNYFQKIGEPSCHGREIDFRKDKN